MRDVVELLDLLTPELVLSNARDFKESQWFDRKSARVTARTLAETLVAFANAEGGLVLIGMHDGVAADAGADDKAVNAWRQAGIDFAQPPVRTEVRVIPWSDPSADRAGSFVLVDVPASDIVHATAKDEVFLRVGDENRRLSFLQRTRAAVRQGPSPVRPYDPLRCDHRGPASPGRRRLPRGDRRLRPGSRLGRAWHHRPDGQGHRRRAPGVRRGTRGLVPERPCPGDPLSGVGARIRQPPAGRP